MRFIQNKLIASVKKALDALDVLIFEDIQGRGLGLSELSRRLEMKPNTLHGILQTIVSCGYAEQDEKARYRIGRRCRQIGIVNRFHIAPDTGARLNKALGALCEETGESVSFYVLDEGERINYANFESRDIIKIDYTMLEEYSIYDYPSGRILAAYAEADELERILKKHGFPGARWKNITTREALLSEIGEIRRAGLLTRYSEEGVASYAVPVFEKGRLLGAAGVYMPLYRKTEEKEREIQERLKTFSARFEGEEMK